MVTLFNFYAAKQPKQSKWLDPGTVIETAVQTSGNQLN